MDISPEQILKMSDEEVDVIIRRYYNEDDWNNLTRLERLRNRLMFVNFVSHPDLAFLLPTPIFLLPKDQQSKLNNPNNGVDKKKKPEKKKRKLDAKAKTKKAKKDKQSRDTTSGKDGQSKVKPNKVMEKNKKIEKKERIIDSEIKNKKKVKIDKQPGDSTSVRKNPVRATKTTVANYYEEEAPDDDRYIFCDACQTEVLDYCPTCGMLVLVTDVDVPLGEPDRAKKTIPPVFEIRPSTVHGLGVFARREIPFGIQMGPYEGTVSRVSNTNGYSWKLKNGILVDAADETVSNWMRYVNCAPHSAAQNLIAFQYKGELLYRTARPIEQGEELLVYYGNSFARELGIEPEKYFDPVSEPSSRTCFLCKHCRVGLSTEKYRNLHEGHCRFRYGPRHFRGPAFQCLHCTLLYTTEKDRDDHQKRCEKKSNLKKCLETNASKNQKLHFCDKCDYKTNNKGNLIRHVRIHNKENEPTFNCNQCSFHTIHNCNLKRHLRTHNTFGLICILCQKMFKRKQNLDGHYISKHAEQFDTWKTIVTSKVNTCLICPYKTVCPSNFKNHLRTHESGSDWYTFTCNICGYKCVQKGTFKTHLRVHVDDLPFVCVECDKRFNYKGHLDGHIISHHSDKNQLLKTITHKVHFCSNCNYKSIRISDLKKHVKSCQ